MGYRLVCVALLVMAIGQVHPVEEEAMQTMGERNIRRANMNAYVDYCLTYMAPIFRDNNVVPMNLPDTSIGWEASPIWITYGGIIDLHNGILLDIESILRAGDCFLSYNRQLLRMELITRVSRSPFHYDYETRVMGLGIFRGWVEGHMSDKVIHLDLMLDMFDFWIFLQNFRLVSIGETHVRVRGNVLTDWLANVIIDIVIFFFENTIANLVSNTLRDFIQQEIDAVNANRVRFSAIGESNSDLNLIKYTENVINYMQQKYENVL